MVDYFFLDYEFLLGYFAYSSLGGWLPMKLLIMGLVKCLWLFLLALLDEEPDRPLGYC